MKTVRSYLVPLFVLFAAEVAAKAPRVVTIYPTPGSALSLRPGSITVTLDQNIQTKTVNSGTFRLVRSGGDGVFGNGNDVTIAPETTPTLGGATTARFDLGGVSLPRDVYQVRLVGESAGTWPPGSALDFDGPLERVVVPHSPSLTLTTMTIEAWIYPRSFPTGLQPSVILRKGGAYRTNYELRTWASGKLEFCVEMISAVGVGVTTTESLHLDRWYHVAGVFGGQRIGLYLDGELVVSKFTDRVAAHNSDPLGIGLHISEGLIRPWDGRIDEVRLWNVVRTGDDIRRDAHQPLTGTEPGLVACWDFNEGSGQVIHDKSPFANHGTLGSTTAVEPGAEPAWVVFPAPNDRIRNPSNLPLDGEYFGSFPSGDGTPGGDFVTTFSLSPTLRVLSLVPAPGSALRQAPGSIVVTFAEDIQPASVNAQTFLLKRSGADRSFGTADDVAISASSIVVTGAVATFGLAGAHLPPDFYQITLSGTQELVWGTPANVAEINTDRDESDPSLSADGLTLYWSSDRAGGVGGRDIWMVTRPDLDSPWTTSVNVLELNSSSYDMGPSISSDGLEMYFQSGRSGHTHIWVATRPHLASSWRTPQPVSGQEPDVGNDDPCLTRDGFSLYFYSTNRPVGGDGIWRMTRAQIGGAWGIPVRVAELGEKENEPCVSADHLTIYVSSGRAGGLGSSDIWVATRPNTASSWGNLVNETALSSPAREESPDISVDGKTIYFTSTRSGGRGAKDIWVSKKVPRPGTPGAVTNPSGQALDGEFTGVLPSGDGVEGGNFIVYFRIRDPSTSARPETWRLYQ